MARHAAQKELCGCRCALGRRIQRTLSRNPSLIVRNLVRNRKCIVLREFFSRLLCTASEF